MPTYSVRIDIDRHVEDAWEVLMDESRMGEWLTGYRGIELIEGEPRTVGSKHKILFEDRGKELVLIETVTAIDPPREFAIDLDHELMNSSMSTTLERIGPDRTRLVSTTETRSPKLLWKIILPFMTPQMRKRNRGDLEKLKALIEAS